MFWNIFLGLLWLIVTVMASFATFRLFEDDEFLIGSGVGIATLASWSLMISVVLESLSGVV